MSRRVASAQVLFALWLAAGSASAGFVDTPACRERLARADAEIRRVVERSERMEGLAVAGRCEALAANRRDIASAATSFEACLTGHERDENLGQMLVSIEDIDLVLAARCR